ncbi:C1 family peptidase [Pseudomonas sp. CT11-2]|uniref:C1 family peptidase n=1 Tax=unclassified Pseudomonas TaxID=196821 RepID=UPI00215E9E82|nr:C1 family peptidase [Pseudomonas sp. B21-019]UVM33105.1 C1 family peptidase [Pseudomonas sp. B21-019]
MIVHKVMLDGYGSPARSQGRRPTCLAFALSDLNRPGAPADLSPEFLYRAAAILSPAWAPGGGVTFDAMQGASLAGQPEETAFPYCPEEPSHPIPDLPADLQHYGQVLQHVSADPTDIACFISVGQPVGLGLRVTPEFFKPAGDVVLFSDQVMPGLLHAVVAIGLGHEEGSSAPWFYVRNSWGPQWGVDGHAWISGAYVSAHAECAFGVENGKTDRE